MNTQHKTFEQVEIRTEADLPEKDNGDGEVSVKTHVVCLNGDILTARYDFKNKQWFDHKFTVIDDVMGYLKPLSPSPVTKERITELISKIKEKIEYIREFEMSMTKASFDYEEGIVITGEQGELIISELSLSERKMTGEYILCAAIWYKDIQIKRHIPDNTLPINIEFGLVFCGHRHAHCMHTMTAITGINSVATQIGEYIQGFLTNKNRFIDRHEAYDIAFKADQIIGPNKGYSTNHVGLTSEDLY